MKKAIAILGAAMMVAPAYAAPAGWTSFCSSNPSQCVSQGSEEVALTIDLLVSLDTVNQSVNNSMKYRREATGLDWWRVNTATGDCEDFALTKRARLLSLGVDQSALRMAVVLNEKAEIHAVLVVETTEGELVLDNIYQTVEPFDETGYILVSMSPSDPKMW